jgi:hypothetical protein
MKNIYKMINNCLEDDDMEKIMFHNKCVIKLKHSCYCYDDSHRLTEFIFVNKPVITGRDIVQALEDYDTKHCNHVFLEILEKINDVTVEPWFGS